MAPRTNIDIVISRLLKEVLTSAKWAERNGTTDQKAMMLQYTEVTLKVIRKLSPNYASYVIPVWMLPSDRYVKLCNYYTTPPAAPQRQLTPYEQGYNAYPSTYDNPFHPDSQDYADYARGYHERKNGE